MKYLSNVGIDLVFGGGSCSCHILQGVENYETLISSLCATSCCQDKHGIEFIYTEYYYRIQRDCENLAKAHPFVKPFFLSRVD